MCQGVENDVGSPPIMNKADLPRQSTLFTAPTMLANNIKSILSAASVGLLQGPYTKRKILLILIISSLLLGTITFTSFYYFHTGFRRTVQFWRGIGPLAIKYKALKIKAKRWDKLSEDDEEYIKRLSAYREATAPKLVELILK